MNTQVRMRAPWTAALVIALCLLAGGWFGHQVSRTSAASSMGPAVRAQVLDVDCGSQQNVGSAFSKLMDIGDFTVQTPESLVEITFNARIEADSMTGNGVRFEIRVDDLASTLGRAQAIFRSDEIPFAGGIQASITAVYDNLSAGSHALSLWACVILMLIQNNLPKLPASGL